MHHEIAKSELIFMTFKCFCDFSFKLLTSEKPGKDLGKVYI